MSVVALPVLPPLPDDLPGRLRELADWVEKGIVTQMVLGFAVEGEYEFLWPSSLHDSVVLCSMMQQQAIDNMRR